MAQAMMIFSIVSTVVGMISQQQAASDAAKQARAQALREKQAADYKKAQLEQKAQESSAIAQREVLNEKQKEKMVMSRAMALSAASGAGASDPPVQNLLSDISGEGAYRQGLALYEGEERARSYRMGADAAEFEGNNALLAGEQRARAARASGMGSLFSGATSLFSKYGMGGPGGSNPPPLVSEMVPGQFSMGNPAYG